jgi:26S proteasome regulatory subunit T3
MSRGRSPDAAVTITRILTTLFDRSLKRELVRAQEEIKRIQSVPLVIGQFMEAIDQKYACVAIIPVGDSFY